MFDIAAIGEMLIDFTECGRSKAGMRLFEQNPGGAPCNLLTEAARQGLSTAFIGKVGRDMHGEYLRAAAEAEGIDLSGLVEDESVFTTLAFVSIGTDGEREFSFARKPGADMLLNSAELNLSVLKNCRIFCFGSLPLTGEPSGAAALSAVNIAKAAGAVIAFDPNYRPLLWESEAQAISVISSALRLSDLVKVSGEEALLLTGRRDPEDALDDILARGPTIAAVTLGRDGAVCRRRGGDAMRVPPYRCRRATDATGAGDAWFGAFLSGFLRQSKGGSAQLTDGELYSVADRANAAASLSVERRGGIPSMPTGAETDERMAVGRQQA